MRRPSGELEVEKKRKMKYDYVINMERGERAEIKQKKLNDNESKNKDVEVFGKVGNILRVKTSKVPEERNTGRIRNISKLKTLLEVTIRGP